MENEKDKENDIKDISGNNNVLESPLFSNSFLPIFHKTEKIVVALYMVTSFIKDGEPLKRQIRNEAVFILSDTISCMKASPREQLEIASGLIVSLDHIVSMFSVAERIGFVSVMNAAILKRELGLLREAFVSFIKTKNKFIGEEALFESPTIPEGFFGTEFQGKTHETILKKDISGKERGEKKESFMSQSKRQEKEVREKKILSIIKEKKQVSIKDIATRITNCSEKTIQRDLIELIKDGFVRKEGDKRWSVYVFIKDKS